jgi:transposase InsO family protein
MTGPLPGRWRGGIRRRVVAAESIPRAIESTNALAIVELRHKRLTQARIAATLGVSKSTVSRVLSRAGLSLLSNLDPVEAVVHYEHEAPGNMLHIDTKKLGRIERPSHPVTGNRRDSVDGAGWEMLFVAIDDHARIAFTAMHANARTPSAVQFLRDAVAYCAGLGVSLQGLITDNGSAFRFEDFAAACEALGVRHRFTRPYQPQTNGNAERFIQSALREWAYGFIYQHSTERTKALDRWNYNYNYNYNWNRPHQGIGGVVPMSRLNSSRNNLLTLHS